MARRGATKLVDESTKQSSCQYGISTIAISCHKPQDAAQTNLVWAFDRVGSPGHELIMPCVTGCSKIGLAQPLCVPPSRHGCDQVRGAWTRQENG